MIDKHEDSSKIIVSKWLAGLVLAGFVAGASGLVWLGSELSNAQHTASQARKNAAALAAANDKVAMQNAKLDALSNQVSLLRQEVQYDEQTLTWIAHRLGGKSFNGTHHGGDNSASNDGVPGDAP